MKVQVVPHDPEWRGKYELEAEVLRAALKDVVHSIDHIGSTAVPGIYAKPIIDLLVEVDDLGRLDTLNPVMVGLGYVPKGELGITGRRYFSKDSGDGTRTHQVHAFVKASAGIQRHIAFRDYLIAHPATGDAYGALKRRLAVEFPDDIHGFAAAKHDFVQEHERRALAWKSARQCS
jgi:GrpB-like predicted nucleotidyltransferase (UPF0157 family)